MNTLRDISKSISDHIEPKLYPQINEEQIEDKTCIVIDFTGKSIPYFAFGRAYIRTADEDRILSSKELEILILKKNKDKLGWDNDICVKANISDISSKKIKEYVLKTGLKFTSKKEVLENLELIINDKLTNAAIILFGKNTSEFFPLLNLRCATFIGDDSVSKFLDMTDYEGDLFELISFAEKYILQKINVGMRLNGLVRVDVPEINFDAFRETIINAFCHRDYSIPQEINIAVFKNKVEIRNPGELYGGLTIDDILFKRISKRRNSLIANIFHRIHFVEKWGTGISKIKSLEPDTEFKVFAGFFSATFKRKNIVVDAPVKLNNLQNGILNEIDNNKNITYDELSDIFNKNRVTIMRNISKLKQNEFIERVGSNKNGYWVFKKNKADN